jgi:hypothetical protein
MSAVRMVPWNRRPTPAPDLDERMLECVADLVANLRKLPFGIDNECLRTSPGELNQFGGMRKARIREPCPRP